MYISEENILVENISRKGRVRYETELTKCFSYPGPMGVAVDKGDHFKLIDGYHRYSAINSLTHKNKPVKVIVGR